MQSKHWPIETYFLLKKEVEEKGLFNRKYFSYLTYLTVLLFGFAISFYLVINFSENIFIQIINAFFFTVVVLQAGTLGHDLSHNQVFKSKKLNQYFAFWAWGLLAGLTSYKWFLNHNEHHKNVNHDEKDPDLAGIPFIFDEHQREFVEKEYPQFAKLRKYQHIIFWLVLPSLYLFNIKRSISFAIKDGSLNSTLELFLMLLRQSALLLFLFTFLPTWTAAIFLIIHVAFGGVYMSFIFAPNHKGMETISDDTKTEWYHQITLTRNLYPNKLAFYLMSGLNYQIEHHLFTNIARFNMAETGKVVKKFCIENNIPYYETAWAGSIKEIYNSLKTNSG